ncbi:MULTISPECIES: ABC transporter substrate-binding protein [unclassified Streptomyces]|uniref:ABC transporter substrate-binding protein n=1 Tax=unclassified Streptomyces TaxID=2593676 RepID=UPI0038068882
MTAPTPRRSTVTSRFAAVGAIAVAGALVLTGCGDQTDKGSSASPSTSASKAPLFDKLPASVQSAGVIKVGSDIAYAPVEFVDGGKTVGMDPDLADALGEQLGVKFEFNNGTFDTLLTGLRGKRYDVVMSAMSDTKNRQDGVDSATGKKVGEGVDFVDYFTAGSSIIVRKGNPEGIKSLADLCGKNVAVQRGTTSQDLLKAQKCDKPMAIQPFDTDADAQTRLKAGGVVADVSDFPVAAYAVKTSGGGQNFELAGEQVEAGPYGIAVSKSNTQLRDALQAALDAIIKDGSYSKVMEKWGVSDGAVTEAKVNGGS